MAGTEWCWPLPAWMGSGAAWFVALNLVVGAIFALSSRAQPQSPSPRRAGSGGGITRRASSAVLQRIRSFSIFSFPSSCFHTAEPSPGATAAATFRETEDAGTPTRRSPATPRDRVPRPHATAEPAKEDAVEDENSMSMDEAYALALAGRQRAPPTEEEAAGSEVDAKAEEFIQGFKEDLRQQRLNSIFNYTQMLKRRAAGGQPPAAPE
ncbi:hypothetical protein CFC21_077464 [Triticum aestivum]|uniref:DUF4408 domain-containing protein n=4 Tax=Triticinae TaxID=1648030 RepID=A0A453KPS3_AEGTS|nr:uncharacterized protein LOC109741409 [Aegilops tauschii subsp. strangulata]XP_044397256.1 uncharacterized protein LOC123121365 [Triticum aestivum]KAF7072317.1 hypothetical protein CFC21_077464 [Triticum aestivum]